MRMGYEDWEFNISVIKKGWDIFIIKEYLFNYRNKLNSRNSQANEYYRYDLKRYIYKKHSDICCFNIDLFINYFFRELEDAKETNITLRRTLDFRIGKSLLKPIRLIKFFFK
jgi:hypothetical protein